MRKIFNVFKHSFSIVMSNKPRYYLTAVGIIVSVVLFISANVVLNSTYHSEAQAYAEFDSDCVYAKSMNLSQIEEVNTKFGGSFALYNSPKLTMGIEFDAKNSLELYVCGVNENFCYSPIPSINNSDTLVKTKLIAGRCFNQTDMMAGSRTLIVYQTFADIFFDGDALGKTLKVAGEERVIVGVLEDSVDVIKEKEDYLKSLKEGDVDRVVLYSFVPYTSINNFQFDVVFSNLTNSEYVAQFIETKYDNRSVQTFDRLMLENNKKLSNSKELLDIALYLILIIASLMIAVIMIFSVKERIGEIGIKKAIGATNSDITLQFVFEALFLALVTSVISIVLGFGLSIIILTFMGIENMNFSISMILLPILCNVFICLLSSIVPSIVANKKNIVEALRFE